MITLFVIGSAGTSRGDGDVRALRGDAIEDGAGADVWRRGVVPPPRLE